MIEVPASVHNVDCRIHIINKTCNVGVNSTRATSVQDVSDDDLSAVIIYSLLSGSGSCSYV